jgi:hypothetical protein
MKLAFAAAAAALMLAGAAPALAQDAAPLAPPPPAQPTAASKHAEAVIRASIDQLNKGTLDASAFTPQMMDQVRPQLAAIQGYLNKLGPLQSVTFLGEQDGADGFRVQFQAGPTIWVVHFDAAGKVDGMQFRPEQAEGAAPQG